MMIEVEECCTCEKLMDGIESVDSRASTAPEKRFRYLNICEDCRDSRDW